MAAEAPLQALNPDQQKIFDELKNFKSQFDNDPQLITKMQNALQPLDETIKILEKIDTGLENTMREIKKFSKLGSSQDNHLKQLLNRTIGLSEKNIVTGFEDLTAKINEFDNLNPSKIHDVIKKECTTLSTTINQFVSEYESAIDNSLEIINKKIEDIKEEISNKVSEIKEEVFGEIKQLIDNDFMSPLADLKEKIEELDDNLESFKEGILEQVSKIRILIEKLLTIVEIIKALSAMA